MVHLLCISNVLQEWSQLVKKIKKGMKVRVTEDYDVFGENANGLVGIVLRPYSVDRETRSSRKIEKIVKHLIYIESIDAYCEPRHEWLEVVT